MGKLEQRMTTEIYAVLLSWRRLTPSQYYYSGQSSRLYAGHQLTEYEPCLQFQSIEWFPANDGYWEDHWLGKDFRDRYWVLPADQSFLNRTGRTRLL